MPCMSRYVMSFSLCYIMLCAIMMSCSRCGGEPQRKDERGGTTRHVGHGADGSRGLSASRRCFRSRSVQVGVRKRRKLRGLGNSVLVMHGVFGAPTCAPLTRKRLILTRPRAPQEPAKTVFLGGLGLHSPASARPAAPSRPRWWTPPSTPRSIPSSRTPRPSLAGNTQVREREAVTEAVGRAPLANAVHHHLKETAGAVEWRRRLAAAFAPERRGVPGDSGGGRGPPCCTLKVC